ncbi:hypothetical protein [Nonomuraea sp. NPDC049129]|jgi:hypothetical protein|uniref:hypothetical protein n=1 Tax=Nonomuraea sp. NPDC049129 TaxID=3155272 RepID=UPI0033E930A9
MSATPAYCPCGKTLHTKHCLAELFNCKPRAVVRMAASGRWGSTRVTVGKKGTGEYRWTDEMIAEIVSEGEQRPAARETANEPKRQAVKPQPVPRRTRQPQPAPISGSNVRPLVAKGPRIGKAS